MRWLAAVVLMGITGTAFSEIRVDHVSVNVEKRAGRDWCLLDAQVSGPIEAGIEAVAAVIQDYAAYPQFFPHIRDAAPQVAEAGVLLSETLFVDTLGLQNINRFTVRMLAEPTAHGFRLSWVQATTDGTIDGVEGEWLLERRGTAEKPVTWVTYRTKSAVLMKAFGQDLLLRMFLGGETKAIVEAVARNVRSRISASR
jgi:hypothetical protein